MNENIKDSQYLDLFSILLILINNKFKILLASILGAVLSLMIFYEPSPDYRSEVEISFTDKLKTTLNYNFRKNTIEKISEKSNIYESLNSNGIFNIEESSLDNQLVSNIESKIKIDILNKENININFASDELIFIDPILNISLTHKEDLADLINIDKFLGTLVINGQYSVIKEYISLLEFELETISNLLEEEKLFINNTHKEQEAEIKLILDLDLSNQDNIKNYKIKKITENLKIAESLGYAIPQVEFQPSIASSETIVMNTFNNESELNREIRLPKSPDIYSYAINQGIPLYLFGSNILKSELLLLRENTQYEDKFLQKELENLKYQIDQNRLLELEEMFMSLEGKQIKQLENEINRLKLVKKENSLIVEYNDINYVYSYKVASNIIFKMFIGTLLFFLTSCFIVLFTAENKRRKFLIE